MSSKYTLQLYYIYKDDNYNLFDQPYNLYNNELKPYFEEKFFQHFMFYEIGFDNVNIFKQHLISTLNDIYPKYKQLYETEIRCQNIDFMLNKYLKGNVYNFGSKVGNPLSLSGKVFNSYNCLSIVSNPDIL